MNADVIPVLLTAIGGGGHGEQILKALRLGERKYFIVGTDINPVCANRGYVDVFTTLPKASDPHYLESVLGLARKYKVAAVFHGSEPEMMVLGANRESFSAENRYLPINPISVLETCRDKFRTATFLSQLGFPAPRSVEISQLSDLEAFKMVPAIIKPSIGGGSANVMIAQTVDEIYAFAGYLLNVVPSLVVQEYVGRPDEEYTVGVLYGQDGSFINSIAVKRVIGNALSVRSVARNRTGRSEFGDQLVVSSGVSQGHVGRWPEVTKQCEAIAAALHPTAPINIQCRLVDGVVVPFEINPRFSGTTSLRAMAGYNEPDILIRRDVLGETITPHFSYRELTVMRSLAEQEIP